MWGFFVGFGWGFVVVVLRLLFLLCNSVLKYPHLLITQNWTGSISHKIFVCFFLLSQNQLCQNHPHRFLCRPFNKNIYCWILHNSPLHSALDLWKYVLMSVNPLLQYWLIPPCHWIKEADDFLPPQVMFSGPDHSLCFSLQSLQLANVLL